jgi:hypothetical protein
MSKSRNPYPKQPGFGFRFLRARTALQEFGRNGLARPYSRSFDNCFENFDGHAVVWALMDHALRNEAADDRDLAEGIRRMGKAVWPQWLQVYEGHDPDQPWDLFEGGAS